ncbi:MAG TPA: hypothetical protein VGY54_27075 [Polyangiaceae bacterium]|jgi:hypothetical protein|nr:hypothetical protein [Polyangiaceae bacterium]
MPKLDAEELWRAMKEQAAEDDQLEKELAAVSKMTEAQLDDELRAAGFEVAHAERTARALYERAYPMRRRSVVLLAAATSAVAAAVVAAPTAVMVAQPMANVGAPPPADTSPAPRPSASHDAAAVRRAALAACSDGRWLDCLAGLNLARAGDPAGDADPIVVSARRQATAGIALVLAQSADAGAPSSNAKTGADSGAPLRVP